MDKYLREVRPGLQQGVESHTLFLYDDGGAFPPGRLGDLIKRHLEHASIVHPGACHLFRHAMATHMLHNSADLRSLQTILGHADLTTTQIYTHVVPDKFKDVHAATHPAKLRRAAQPEVPGDAALSVSQGPEVTAQQPQQLAAHRLEAVCAAIEQRTHAHLADDARSPCYELLVYRREQIGGMLELARRLEDHRLVRFLESHKVELSRVMESR